MRPLDRALAAADWTAVAIARRWGGSSRAPWAVVVALVALSAVPIVLIAISQRPTRRRWPRRGAPGVLERPDRVGCREPRPDVAMYRQVTPGAGVGEVTLSEATRGRRVPVRRGSLVRYLRLCRVGGDAAALELHPPSADILLASRSAPSGQVRGVPVVAAKRRDPTRSAQSARPARSGRPGRPARGRPVPVDPLRSAPVGPAAYPDRVIRQRARSNDAAVPAHPGRGPDRPHRR